MIREAISNFQISLNLTKNIMKRITRLKPAASAVLIVLMLGIGNHYLTRFQKPDVRNQLGALNDREDKGEGNGEKANQVLGDKDDWTRWNLPEGAKRRLGKGMFTDMQLSPDGTRLAIASSTGIWLYDVSTGKETSLLTKNTDLIGLVAFSPGGKTLASIDGGNTCRIWDVESQSLLSTFKVPNYWMRSLTFLDDGKTLVAEGLIDKVSNNLTGKNSRWDVPKVWKWDGTTGKLIDTFTTKLPKFNPLKDARISVPVKGFANGDRVIFAFENKDYMISIKDGSTDQEIATLQKPGQEIRAFAFSADGTRLAIAYDRTVHLWNLDTTEQVAMFPIRVADFYGNPSVLAFSKDGKILAVAGLQDISVWNVDTRSHIATFKNREGGLWEFVLSSDGSTVVTLDHRGTVDFWSVNTGKHEYTLTTGYTNRFTALVFTHDGKTIASAAGDKIHLWNTNTGTEEMRMYVPVDIEIANNDPQWNPRAVVPMERGTEIIGLAFSKDKTILNSFHTSGKIGEWDVITGESKNTYTLDGAVAVRVLQINSNPLARGMISAPSPRSSNIYHLFATSFDNVSVYIPEAAFSPNGKLFASKNGNGDVEVWHIPTRESLYTFTRQNLEMDAMLILAFSPNSDTLAISGGEDIHLSNIHSGETFAKFKIPKKKPNLIDKLKSFFGKKHIHHKVEAVALTQFERTHLAASRGKIIDLWDIQTQEHILTIKGHKDTISKLAFTTDGTILASGDIGGTIHLWDIPTGEKLTTFKPYASPITQLVFSPDGRTLASTNLHSRFAGTILLWDVPSK